MRPENSEPAKAQRHHATSDSVEVPETTRNFSFNSTATIAMHGIADSEGDHC